MIEQQGHGWQTRICHASPAQNTENTQGSIDTVLGAVYYSGIASHSHTSVREQWSRRLSPLEVVPDHVAREPPFRHAGTASRAEKVLPGLQVMRLGVSVGPRAGGLVLYST